MARYATSSHRGNELKWGR